MLDQVKELLQDTPELVKNQSKDPALLEVVKDLVSGGMGGDYVLDEKQLLWYSPVGSAPRLAIPQSLKAGIMALVHTTYGHPGVARTILLVQQHYHWPTMKKDLREYVLSCGCRRRKSSSSHRVAMLPARFLRPWDVLEADVLDIHEKSKSDNRYLLLAIDGTSKFAFAFPLKTKEAEGIALKLLELVTLFGIPRSIRSDQGSEFKAEAVSHLCRWLKVPIDYGPTDHPRAQGTVERLGGWLQGVLAELCSKWSSRWDSFVQPALWLHRTTPDPRLPGSPTPFRLLFGRNVRTQIEAVSPELDGSDLMDTGLHSLIANKQEDWRQVLKTDTYQRAPQATRDRERTRINDAIV